MKKMLLDRVGDAENDEELNQRISPLYHADRIRVPLMIGQGANDPRYPPLKHNFAVQNRVCCPRVKVAFQAEILVQDLVCWRPTRFLLRTNSPPVAVRVCVWMGGVMFGVEKPGLFERHIHPKSLHRGP